MTGTLPYSYPYYYDGSYTTLPYYITNAYIGCTVPEFFLAECLFPPAEKSKPDMRTAEAADRCPVAHINHDNSCIRGSPASQPKQRESYPPQKKHNAIINLV